MNTEQLPMMNYRVLSVNHGQFKNPFFVNEKKCPPMISGLGGEKKPRSSDITSLPANDSSTGPLYPTRSSEHY